MNEQEVKIPRNVLKEEEFAGVLVDFALAESASTMNIKGVPSNRLDSVYRFDPLKEHGVRKSQFDSTQDFYTRHPVLYKRVYEIVLENLSELEARKDSARK